MSEREERAKACHDRVRNLFIYQSDEKSYDVIDDWRTHADSVRNFTKFTDDCDGFAMTCADLLVNDYNIPAEDVRLVLCLTEGGGGHLICIVDDEDDSWAVDNRYSYVMSWKDLSNYTWIAHVKLDDPTQWFAFDGSEKE
jgi:predicted transglutaminase-like cysteine proteinase